MVTMMSAEFLFVQSLPSPKATPSPSCYKSAGFFPSRFLKNRKIGFYGIRPLRGGPKLCGFPCTSERSYFLEFLGSRGGRWDSEGGDDGRKERWLIRSEGRTRGFKISGNDDGYSGRSMEGVEEISSVRNEFIKHCVKLRQRASYRKLNKMFLVVGDVPIKELCEVAVKDTNRPPRFVIQVLFVSKRKLSIDGWDESILSSANRVVCVSPPVMQKLSGFESSDSLNYIAVVDYPSSFLDLSFDSDVFSDINSPSQPRASQFDLISEYDLISKLEAFSSRWLMKNPTRVLVLDGIQDPGNLGTLFRTAVAFSWDCIVLLPGCCDPFNEKALRASKGAVSRIPIIVSDWKSLVIFAKAFKLELYAGQPGCTDSPQPSTNSWSNQVRLSQKGISAEQHGDFGDDNLSISENKHDDNDGMSFECEASEYHHLHVGKRQYTLEEVSRETALCLVLGSEGQGISEMVKEVCKFVEIPMTGGMESLNVAIAGGIFLYGLGNKHSIHHNLID